MSNQTLPNHDAAATTLTKSKREEIIRRYWLNGDLTPLAIANRLAGQKTPEPA